MNDNIDGLERIVKSAGELEGKYFVFEFDADYTEDTRGIAVLQVVDGKLEERWHPCDHSFLNIMPRDINEQAIEYLKKQEVTEVYTLKKPLGTSSPTMFLGGAHAWDTDENNWGGYDPLDHSSWTCFFKEHNIRLIVVDYQGPEEDISYVLKDS